MRICEIMQKLRLHFEPKAREHGMTFAVAPDPQAPYTAILAGGGGQCILVYAGQARIDDTPGTSPPVGSRFEIFVSASTALSADKAGGGQIFRQDGGTKKPLYEICEDFELDITGFEIPDNDGSVEPRTFYQSTDPAVMPDGYVLSAYKIAFQIRRAMV